MFRIKGIVKKVLLMIGVEMLEIDRWNMRYGWLSLFGLLRVIKVWMKDCRRVWEWNFNSDYGDDGLEGFMVDLDKCMGILCDMWYKVDFEGMCVISGEIKEGMRERIEKEEVRINRYEFLNVGVMVVNWKNYLDEFGIESIEE